MLNEYLYSPLISDWHGYACIDSEQVIHDANPFAEQFAASSGTINSLHVCEAFEELVGCEEALTDILSGKLPYLEFHQINKPDSKGITRYLDFKIMPRHELNPLDGIILLIKDSPIG